MGVLKHSDLFLANRDEKSYRAQVAQMKEYFGKGVLTDPVIEPDVSVLSPADGAGLGPAERYLVSDRIVDVATDGDFAICETDLIQNVSQSNLIYPNASHFVFRIPRDADWYDDDDILTVWVTNAADISWRLDDPGEPPRGTLQGANSVISRFGDLKGHKLIISRTGNYQLSLNGFGSPGKGGLTDITYGGTIDFVSLVEPPTQAGDGYKIADSFGRGAGVYNFTSGETLDNIVLSFPTSKDFDCFPAGTVIKDTRDYISDKFWTQYGGVNTYDGLSYNRDKIWNGSIASHTECTIGANGSQDYWVWEYPQGIPFKTIKIRGSRSGVLQPDSFRINGENVTNTSSLATWPTISEITTYI